MLPLALIVEDDDGLRTIYKHILINMGFTIIEAEDGQTALDLLQVHTPHIVFLDVRLPLVGGMQILDVLRADARFSMTRVVIASSNHPPSDLPVDERVNFILKPIRPMQIRELAASVL